MTASGSKGGTASVAGMGPTQPNITDEATNQQVLLSMGKHPVRVTNRCTSAQTH